MEASANLRLVAKDKVDAIHLAIEKYMEEKKKKKGKITTVISGDSSLADDDDDDEEERLHLSRLLAQLELLKEDDPSKLSEPPAETKEPPSSAITKVEKKDEVGRGSGDGRTDKVNKEIVKELKKVKKQNVITHCLLSVMTVLVVAWQLSEVSLILKVKNTLKNPIKSVGDVIKDAMKDGIGGGDKHELDGKCRQIEPPSLPPLRALPDFPRMDLDSLDT